MGRYNMVDMMCFRCSAVVVLNNIRRGKYMTFENLQKEYTRERVARKKTLDANDLGRYDGRYGVLSLLNCGGVEFDVKSTILMICKGVLRFRLAHKYLDCTFETCFFLSVLKIIDRYFFCGVVVLFAREAITFKHMKTGLS